MISRPEYLKKLLSVKDTDLVKIVTGVRRSGKSTLFKLYRAELLKQGVLPEQIQSINLEDLENEHLTDYRKLYEQIKGKLVPGKKNYVFLDEVQAVDGFGKVIDSLFLKDVDVYVTGSNSKLLSGDIEHTIQRQKFKIEMYPLSFKEYLNGYSDSGMPLRAPDVIYEQYVKYGAFPRVLGFIKEATRKASYEKKTKSIGFRANQEEHEKIQELATNNSVSMSEYLRSALSLHMNDTELQPLITTYLSEIYDRVVLKDIVENKSVKDVGRLKTVLRFMADNVGKDATSILRMSKIMTDSGCKINTHTLESYIEAFCDSFMLYRADRYDVRGKAILKTQQKYYMVDSGIRGLLLGDTSLDRGRVLENIVYLELLRRGYTVNIGKAGDKEIDFVAKRGDIVEYYQVAQSVLDEATHEREFSAFDGIKDNHPKFVLTRDYTDFNQDGIKHINVLKWLLDEE